jgi:hypothetical protein
VRVGYREDGMHQQTRWGQLLTVPMDGYLEASGGPTPFRDVEWAEISTKRIRGGMVGHPLELIDVTDKLLEGLRAMSVTWQMLETSWTKEGMFVDQPVLVVRIVNPFGPPSAITS